jgi:hemerythrin
MRAAHYPGYAEHKRQHDRFIVEVLENIHDYETQKHYTLFSFTKFLKDWVLSHIGVMDRQYFLNKKKILSAYKIGERPKADSANIA